MYNFCLCIFFTFFGLRLLRNSDFALFHFDLYALLVVNRLF